MNKLKTFSIILVTLTLMTACVDSEKGKLDNRVLDFWHAKINRDYKAAYQFLSPGWKSSESEQSYVQRMLQSKAKWIKADVKNKKCKTKSLCELSLSIVYQYKFKAAMGRKMTVPTTIQENWIMKNNTWYNLPKEIKLK